MKSIKPNDIKHNWHLIDAKNKILGRLSTEAAEILMGKNKSYYSPNLDTGDFVVVINAQKVTLSGKKESQKIYWRHSQYPGGLRSRTVAQQRILNPEEIIRHSIVGMLPKTKMGKNMAKKLFIYKTSEHPYSDKFKQN